MRNAKRSSLFINDQVQKRIFYRVGIYWVVSMVLLTIPVALTRTIFFDPNETFLFHIGAVMQENTTYYLLATLMLLFVLNDVAIFTNRFIGPIYRLRSDLASFHSGKKLRPIRFRDNDHWKDLAESVNQLVSRIQELEVETGAEPTVASFRVINTDDEKLA